MVDNWQIMVETKCYELIFWIANYFESKNVYNAIKLSKGPKNIINAQKNQNW